MENYFASQRDNIFRNVEVLIYVFDVESTELEKDMHYYQSCLEAILQNSPQAKVFCLVHKMDLVQDDQRERVRKEGIVLFNDALNTFYLRLYGRTCTTTSRVSRPSCRTRPRPRSSVSSTRWTSSRTTSANG